MGKSVKCLDSLFYHLQCYSAAISYVIGIILKAVGDSREIRVSYHCSQRGLRTVETAMKEVELDETKSGAKKSLILERGGGQVKHGGTDSIKE